MDTSLGIVLLERYGDLEAGGIPCARLSTHDMEKLVYLVDKERRRLQVFLRKPRV